MNWIIKTLVGAVVAGVGLKIGSDMYESAKKTLQQVTGTDTETETKADESPDEDLEGVLETEVVDLEQEGVR